MGNWQEKHKNQETEVESSFSPLVSRILDADCDISTEDLQMQLDPLVKLSVPIVLKSILLRSRTQQVKELQKIENLVNNYFEKFQLMSNGRNRLIWLLGRLSSLLWLVSLFQDELELNVDEYLIKIADEGKHVIDILSTLYDRPQLSQGELAQILGLTSTDYLSEELDTMVYYRLVFAHSGGGERYYTLSANGKKAYKHIKLRREITPEQLTKYLMDIFDNLSKALQSKALQGEETFKDAESQFRQFARQYAPNHPDLQSKMRKMIELMQNRNGEMSALKVNINNPNRESSMVPLANCKDEFINSGQKRHFGGKCSGKKYSYESLKHKSKQPLVSTALKPKTALSN